MINVRAQRARELARMASRSAADRVTFLERPWTPLEWKVATIALTKLGEEDHRSVWTRAVGDEAIAVWASVGRSTARRVMRRLTLAGLVRATAPSGSRPRRYRVKWSRR